MSKKYRYAVITPARDEGKNIGHTISSMVDQSIRPMLWVIVDDGSTDDTAKTAADAAREHPWIRVISRSNRGFRKAGGGVIDAFYEGYQLVEKEPWDFLVKLDADLSFASDYFEKCLDRFTLDKSLGIGGGTICSRVGDTLEVESKIDPRFHVRGATKIYSRACWQQIGGLIRAPGWDTLDEVKANMLGLSSCTFSDISLLQLRKTGAAYGTWRDKVKGGVANYVVGYHPLFMFVKCLRRMIEKPYVVGACGLMFGFIKGYVARIPRADDESVIKYFRQQQMNRLLGRKSLWDQA